MTKKALVVVAAITFGLAGLISTQAAGIAAGALLHPSRTKARIATPAQCEDLRFASGDIHLIGWRCRADGARVGTIVYLHGIADNRASGAGVIERYRRKGFDVVAYDNRAHGESGGDVCTYGYFEKQDLRRAIDEAAAGPVILVGTSLGAAVALQHAPDDPRVRGVVAAEVFSDLRTIARERAPFFLPNRIITKAFAIAEKRGRFQIDAVSPVNAARRMRVPVLLIHGSRDRDTKPVHSQRVYEALPGSKRIILVDGAGHNQSLSGAATWDAIDKWIDEVVRAAPLSSAAPAQPFAEASPPASPR